MAQFRKKPVVIEAMQIPAAEPYDTEFWGWVRMQRGGYGVKRGMLSGTPVLKIPTLEGVMSARIGDWVIKGIHGELYPCQADIFAKTYDAVTT